MMLALLFGVGVEFAVVVVDVVDAWLCVAVVVCGVVRGGGAVVGVGVVAVVVAAVAVVGAVFVDAQGHFTPNRQTHSLSSPILEQNICKTLE